MSPPPPGLPVPPNERPLDLGLDSDAWLDSIRAAQEPLDLGTLGPYTLVREVGRGGQGVVYEALAEDGSTRVALKRLVAGALASPATLQRFEREMEAVSVLDHPSIVRPHGLEILEGQPVLVMEWIQGRPLLDWCEQTQPEFDEIVAVLTELADALAHAHRRGIIHRDVKPQNVLVDEAGHARVLDFGLAKWHEFQSHDALTATSQFVGTPAYASPEQIGTGTLDTRSDVYSFGVLAYHLLAGAPPYETEGGLRNVLENIATVEPKRPRSLRPALSREFEAILLRMLEKNPEDRYPSMDAVRSDLERARRGEPVEARIESGLYLLQKLVAKQRVPIALALAFLTLLAAFSIVMTLMYRRVEKEARTVARVESFLGSILSPTSTFSGGDPVELTDLLGTASERLDREFADEPEAARRLHFRLASSYMSLWNWDAVAHHAAAAVEGYREAEGSDSAELSRALQLLGLARTFQNDPSAVPLLEESLRIYEQLHPDEIDGRAELMSFLAFAWWRAADPPDREAAEAAYEEALAVCAKGEPTTIWAGAWYSYAAMAAESGDFETAARRYRRALGIYDRLPVEQRGFSRACHLDFARTLAALGRRDDAYAQITASGAGPEEADGAAVREDVEAILAGSAP